MAVPAGQDGARRLRNGMMPLRPDWNTAWHIYVQKHTSHTIIWTCKGCRGAYLNDSVCLHILELVIGLKGQPPVSCQRKWQPVLKCHAQVTDSFNCFGKLRVKWHPDTGMAMETDGTIASPWSGLHFLVLSGARVSASGIWVRWSSIFIQIVARKTSIHLETKRVSSWFVGGNTWDWYWVMLQYKKMHKLLLLLCFKARGIIWCNYGTVWTIFILECECCQMIPRHTPCVDVFPVSGTCWMFFCVYVYVM